MTILRMERTYGFEYALIGSVVDAITERKVDGVPLATTNTNVLNTTQPRLTHATSKHTQADIDKQRQTHRQTCADEQTLMSPVPGKYSPYLWKETVMTRSVE